MMIRMAQLEPAADSAEWVVADSGGKPCDGRGRSHVMGGLEGMWREE